MIAEGLSRCPPAEGLAGSAVEGSDPTHASWLNQVELFFSILPRRVLRRGEFESVDELAAKVMTFITDYNHKAKPFRWTY